MKNNQIEKYNIQSLALRNERLNKGVVQATFDLINTLSTDSQKANFLELAAQGKFDAKVALACISQTPPEYYQGCTSVTTVQKAFEEKTPTLAQLKKYLGEPVQRAFVEMIVNQFIEMYGLKKAYSMPIVMLLLRQRHYFSIAELFYIFNDYVAMNVNDMYGGDALQIIKIINKYDGEARAEYLEARHTHKNDFDIPISYEVDGEVRTLTMPEIKEIPRSSEDLKRRLKNIL